MKTTIRSALSALFLLLGMLTSHAQGTLPMSMTQVVDTNGHPLTGALLYFYQVGTVATRQDSFQDTGLTIPNQWPLPSDAFGRIPPFYLASGSVHVRLTDQFGTQIFDYPNALVIGPSGGGGGGGASIDPTTILTTGDFKWRPYGGTLTGFVRANGLTIGSAVSGATERANADTQNLFVLLWSSCHLCTVTGGKGASALADFSANKVITTPDCRGRVCGVGDDAMGNSAAGILQAQNITSGGDTTTTDGANAGEANHTLTQAQLPVFSQTPVFTGTQQTWSSNQTNVLFNQNTAVTGGAVLGGTPGTLTMTITPHGTISPVTFGSGATMNVLSTTMLGIWYVKL